MRTLTLISIVVLVLINGFINWVVRGVGWRLLVKGGETRVNSTNIGANLITWPICPLCKSKCGEHSSTQRSALNVQIILSLTAANKFFRFTPDLWPDNFPLAPKAKLFWVNIAQNSWCCLPHRARRKITWSWEEDWLVPSASETEPQRLLHLSANFSWILMTAATNMCSSLCTSFYPQNTI